MLPRIIQKLIWLDWNMMGWSSFIRRCSCLGARPSGTPFRFCGFCLRKHRGWRIMALGVLLLGTSCLSTLVSSSFWCCSVTHRHFCSLWPSLSNLHRKLCSFPLINFAQSLRGSKLLSPTPKILGFWVLGVPLPFYNAFPGPMTSK